MRREASKVGPHRRARKVEGRKDDRYSRDGDYGGQTAAATQARSYYAAAADGSQAAACTQAKGVK